jgi:hypothetical protein
MALFSDVDWAILVGVAAFLLLGKEGGPLVRQFGRYYGRMMRVKQELLTEFAKAAEIPAPTAGRPVSLRQTFLSWEPGDGRSSGIPAAVSVPPGVAVAAALPSAPSAWGPGLGPSTWSGTAPPEGASQVVSR